MKKYVVYSLKGSAIKEDVVRRFSDFFSLRKKLVERWPGIFIPAIPPKKAVGNTDSKIIDKRIRLLNRFCYQLSTVNFLFESEEVKLFQSNGNEIAKAISALPKPNYQEILENDPQFPFALQVKERVEQIMYFLQSEEVLSGHEYGDYI